LLDTNVVSELTRYRPDPDVIGAVVSHTREMAISSTVWFELNAGILKMPAGHRRDYLAGFMSEVVYAELEILDYGLRAATWHAKEHARLSAIGRVPSHSDGMIAAVAAMHRLILVTRNTTDFEDFEGLHVENWFSTATPGQPRSTPTES